MKILYILVRQVTGVLACFFDRLHLFFTGDLSASDEFSLHIFDFHLVARQVNHVNSL